VARTPGRIVVDLGCGFRKHPGSLGVDIAPLPGVDVRADITRTLPFRDSSVDEVHASHVLEHLDDLVSFLNEVYRICKPGGLVHFRFPHGSSNYITWKDPTHQRALFLDTLAYFDPYTPDGFLFHYYHRARFRIVRKRLTFNLNTDTFAPPSRFRRVLGRILDALANRSPRAQYYCERFWGHLFGIEEAHIWLRAIKPWPPEEAHGAAAEAEAEPIGPGSPQLPPDGTTRAKRSATRSTAPPTPTPPR
jgi:SAM-dependent methyltransferase